MVVRLKEMGKPDGDSGANGNALPMSMRSDVAINGLTNAQLLKHGKQEGQTIDLFVGNG
jgi:hypothetical protein